MPNYKKGLMHGWELDVSERSLQRLSKLSEHLESLEGHIWHTAFCERNVLIFSDIFSISCCEERLWNSNNAERAFKEIFKSLDVLRNGYSKISIKSVSDAQRYYLSYLIYTHRPDMMWCFLAILSKPGGYSYGKMLNSAWRILKKIKLCVLSVDTDRMLEKEVWTKT